MNLDKLFHLKENHTDIKTEVMAGITTFMTMAYILAVNPNILSASGMDRGSVFTATALSAFIASCLMALLSNYPFVLAPGMGLNALFTYTICMAGGFAWQEALAMVFICGLINIVITVTKLRKSIVKSIPESLQNAIGGGIGLFIAYLGMNNAGLISFTGAYPSVTPGMQPFNEALELVSRPEAESRHSTRPAAHPPRENPHLVVIKSISKSYGVPGLRLGFLASGDRSLIEAMKREISIWNINSFAEFYMQIFIKYKEDYNRACERFLAERERFQNNLRKIPFLRVIPSEANYFLCEVLPPFTSEKLCAALLEKDILIKNCATKAGFNGRQYIRIAIRDQRDNDRLTEALSCF